MRRGLLPVAALVCAPSAVAAPTAVERALSSELDWARRAAGRGKPDDTPGFDLQIVAIRLGLPVPGAPAAAEFDVTLELTAPVQRVRLLAEDWTPVEIRDPATAVDLPFEVVPDAFAVDVVLPPNAGADGAPIHLAITAQVDLPCGDPAHCQVETDPEHLAQFGWYPVNAGAPLDDRFTLTLDTTTPGDGTACLSGDQASAGLARHQASSVHDEDGYLPAMFWGHLRIRERPGDPNTTTCVRSDLADVEGRMEAAARDVLAHHTRLLGPYPYDHLSLAAVSNASDAALSPLELVLLPEHIWTQNGADGDATRGALLAHEIAHQYFFNRIGVTAPADAWLSESFAEYLSCVYQGGEPRGEPRGRAFLENYWGYVLNTEAAADAPIASEAAVSSPRSFQILYEKGSVVLNHLNARLRAAGMQTLLRTLLDRFGGHILTTADLIQTLRETAGDTTAQWLAEQISRQDVTVIEASATTGHDDDAPLVLRLPIRPRRGAAEPVPLRTYGPGGEQALAPPVVPSEDTLPMTLSGVWEVRVDPDLETFRRVRPQPGGDVNLSGVVDGADFLDVLAHLGEAVPTAAWDDRVDVTDDQIVDDRDLAAVAGELGEGY